jgi:adenosylcobinamide-GDP ribazoletransferase
MISGLLITGAMHEDGFADFCDGYGSGLARNRILEIMKDSSTGVYGTIGLICILAIKFIALLSTGPDNIPIILIVAHTFSRLSPVVLMFSSKYARDTESSKVGIVCSRPSLSSLTVAVITGFSPLFILGMLKAVVIILICAVLFIGFRAYILKRTGGYTGDVLGALQQITEITIYLINIALD